MTGVLAILGKALVSVFGLERARFAFAAETVCASVLKIEYVLGST